MSDGERQTFEAHYFSCADCAGELRVGAAMLEGAKAGFASSSAAGQVVRMPVARPVPRQPVWYRSASVPWAVAASLAILVGYQSLSVVPSLRQAASPVALVPVTLRPESRGAEPVVAPPAPGRPLTFAIEVNGARPDSELTYTLSRADGTRIVSGRAPAPIPGTPLLLLIPVWTQGGPAHYILSVQDAGTGNPLGEYRFEVASPKPQ
jgi:hypothetical protein